MLVIVPYDTVEEDVVVRICFRLEDACRHDTRAHTGPCISGRFGEKLSGGGRGWAGTYNKSAHLSPFFTRPSVSQMLQQGKLYGAVDTTSTTWQLEHRGSRGNGTRQRTTSSTSTVSSQSSFAIVSDVEFTSSFADSTQTSDAEDINSTSTTSASSPVITEVSPWLSPAWENNNLPTSSGIRLHPLSASGPSSPGVVGRLPFNTNPSLASSYSSVDSLNARSGRLLTLYLDKAEPGIWPSLIVGPVPETMSPLQVYPCGGDADVEKQYNIDPSSLALLGLEHLDIRKDKEEAFEYFV